MSKELFAVPASCTRAPGRSTDARAASTGAADGSAPATAAGTRPHFYGWGPSGYRVGVGPAGYAAPGFTWGWAGLGYDWGYGYGWSWGQYQ